MSAKDIQRCEELESQVARLAVQASTQRRRADSLYDRLRKLENVVRAAATVDDMPTRSVLTDLARKVPRHPRPTLTELRKKK